MDVVKTVFYRSPAKGTIAYGNSFYTRAEGVEKMRILTTETRSDTLDSMQRSYSSDNGRSWSDPDEVRFMNRRPQGVHRSYPLPGFVDPVMDELITFVLEGTLPSDEPLEGMKRWRLRYRISSDGGRTDLIDEPIIQEGTYSSDHPCRGVWVGKNSIMMGDITCRPIRTTTGRILIPVQITPLGPGGEYHNPGGGLTYHDSAVLIGKWVSSRLISWDLSDLVRGNPGRSTRGVLEPTIAEMSDGRILMIMRGSNDVRPALPGYKWYSVSEDGGWSWSDPQPWTYVDGSEFYSPSSCSQLLVHSNGACYWLGNIAGVNPRGNLPRHPLVLGQVDQESLLLIRDTVMVVDDRRSGEDEGICLSNFMAHEDRETSEIVLHMTRMFTRGMDDWTSDAYIYRIAPKGGDTS